MLQNIACLTRTKRGRNSSAEAMENERAFLSFCIYFSAIVCYVPNNLSPGGGQDQGRQGLRSGSRFCQHQTTPATKTGAGVALWPDLRQGGMSYTEKYDCSAPQYDDFLRTTRSRKTGKGSMVRVSKGPFCLEEMKRTMNEKKS